MKTEVEIETQIQTSLKLQNQQDTGIWFIGDSAMQGLIEKTATIGKPLTEWGVSIFFGIKTGLNEAFIIDTATKNRLCCEDPKSAEIIKPLLRCRDIQKFNAEWSGMHVISTFPALDIDIDDYPVIQNYLLSFGKERLEQEGNTLADGSKSRKKTGNKWFETQDQIAYHGEFAKDKLVWKRIGSILRFAYDSSQMYALDSTCIMTGEMLYEICAILNSKLGNWILLENAPKTGTGDIIASVQAIEPIRMPEICEINKDIYSEIGALAKQIIQNKASVENNTQPLEDRIDQLVYQLYGLTPEEVAVILTRHVNILS